MDKTVESLEYVTVGQSSAIVIASATTTERGRGTIGRLKQPQGGKIEQNRQQTAATMGNTIPSSSASIGRKTPVTDKATERDEVEDGFKLQCAVSGMRGWRPTMEDHHLMQVRLSAELQDHCLFAIFDGHGGGLTSSYLEQKFLKVLLQQPQMTKYAALRKNGKKSRSDVAGVLLLKQALKQTFVQLDAELKALQSQVTSIMARRHAERQKQQTEEQQQTQSSSESSSSSSATSDQAPTTLPAATERSGSTAIVVLLTPTHIVTANAGDCRGILRRYGRAIPLSFDHKPTNIVERRRILRAGGFIRKKRVDGDLAISRAFGDFSFKERNKVIVTPDFTVYPRDDNGDEFIVLACDGIWDVASNFECSEYVQTMLSNGMDDLGYICEDALDLCLHRKSRDNMTMMIVSMPAMKVDHSSRASLQNALWRTHRQMKSLGSSFTNVKNSCAAATKQAAQKVQEVAKPIVLAY